MTKPSIIFFGNGPLADSAKIVLEQKCDIIHHATSKKDLPIIEALLRNSPHKIYGVLASFGIIIKPNFLQLFEPEGILNIHPSRLPDLRGPSPIESAILRGDTDFSVSVMKLDAKMDAGPLYFQTTLEFTPDTPKTEIYHALATSGATWIAEHLEHLPAPVPQSGSATYTKLLDTSLSHLNPSEKSAPELLNTIRAFQGFPKSRFTINNLDCIILKAHINSHPEPIKNHTDLSLLCSDGSYLVIDRLQPAGKKPMDAKSFVNGYLK